jgi:sucrose-6-phosphatase
MHPFLLVTDLDHTLVGDPVALAELNRRLAQHRQAHGTKLVYNTGRSRTSYQELRTQERLLPPDVLITSVGTEIYLGEEPDRQWSHHLQSGWDRAAIAAVAAQFPDLIPQPEPEQRPFKVSFFLKPEPAKTVLPQLERVLSEQNLPAQLVYSSEKDLDILAVKANKGTALTYVRQLLGFAPLQTVACGDSGNDIALFGEGTRGVIVGNARSELLTWHRTHPDAHHYLAAGHCAAGMLEGLVALGCLESEPVGS